MATKQPSAYIAQLRQTNRFFFFINQLRYVYMATKQPSAYIAQLRYDYVNGRRIAPIMLHNYSNSKKDASRITPDPQLINSNLCRVN